MLNRNNDRGFTLVELVIGLTILAILSAVAVPTLLEFINYQKTDKCMAEAATVLAYMQSEASKSYDMAVGADKIDTYFKKGNFLTKAATQTNMRGDSYVLVVMKDKVGKIATPQNKNSWTIGELYLYNRESKIGICWKDNVWDRENFNEEMKNKGDLKNLKDANSFKTILGKEGYALDGGMNLNRIWDTGWR